MGKLFLWKHALEVSLTHSTGALPTMREAHRKETELEQIRSLAKTVSGKSKMSIAQAKQWIRFAGSGGSHLSNRISKLSSIRKWGAYPDVRLFLRS